MLKASRFKSIAVALVLIALLTAVGGLVISQAAGGGSGIWALSGIMSFVSYRFKARVVKET